MRATAAESYLETMQLLPMKPRLSGVLTPPESRGTTGFQFQIPSSTLKPVPSFVISAWNVQL